MAPAKVRSGAEMARLSIVKKADKSTTQEQPRVLRVGVVLSGRIIDERLIGPGEDVTIGGSERNDFTITDERIPSRFKAFEHKGGVYHLNIADFMEGRLSRDGSSDSFDEFKVKDRARRSGRNPRVELSDDTRGKIVLGETTLLFQMVQRPATAPLPQLPSGVRNGWVKNIDWFFSTMLIVSFVAQVSFVTFLVYRDWPIQPAFQAYTDERLYSTPPSQVQIDELQERLRQRVTVPEDGQPTPGVVETPSPGESTSRPPSTSRVPRPGRSTGGLSADAQDRIRAALDQSAREALGRINIIGSRNQDGQGAVADVLNGGGIQPDQDRVLADITGVRVASADEGSVFRRPVDGRDHAREGVDLGDLRGQAPADQNIGSGDVTEREISGDSRSGPVTVSPTSQGDLDPAAVRRAVASNMGGIASCYERPLQRNHTLAGRVTINFTIGEGGRVVRASAVQNTVAPEVGSCIERRIRTIRFPTPQGGPATFQFPFIFQPSR